MIIVVEGKNDKNKILSVINKAKVLITNGSEVSDNFIRELKIISTKEEIILCLDPDGPGEKIRKTILSKIPTCKSVFAPRNKAISKNKKKVGIEHMNKQDILELFKHVKNPNYQTKITYIQLYKLGLMNNKQKRNQICDKLHIGYSNAKTFLNKVNMFGISIKDIEELL